MSILGSLNLDYNGAGHACFMTKWVCFIRSISKKVPVDCYWFFLFMEMKNSLQTLERREWRPVQTKANRADYLWQAPETPSAYIKRGEHPTRPELRDETPANGDDRVMGIKVPFVTEPIWAGTSVSEWLLLCLGPPWGVSEPDVDPSPHIPAG